MSEARLVLPRIHEQYRNINRLPFPVSPIRNTVRTNYLLTELHCQETLALSVAVILTPLGSYYHQDFYFYQVHTSLWRCFCPDRTPTYRTPFEWPMVSVTDLVPSIFRAYNLDK